MKYLFILLTIFLISCSSPNIQKQPTQIPTITEPAVQQTQQLQKEITNTEPITKTVKQTLNGKEIVYGYSDTNRLLSVDKWQMSYNNGNLAEISSSDKQIKFNYDNNKLVSVNDDTITYNNDRISQIKTQKGNWYFEYVMNKLGRMKLGTAGGTNYEYDNETIKSFTKGNIETKIKYDERQRIRSYDAGDSEFVIGYWRDDKLISLSGNRAIQSLTVSYGPNYPPFQANIISDKDNTVFTSAYTDTLYSAVDTYIYCKYIYKPELQFDPTSYTLFTNYFKGNLENYIINTYVCEIYET